MEVKKGTEWVSHRQIEYDHDTALRSYYLGLYEDGETRYFLSADLCNGWIGWKVGSGKTEHFLVEPTKIDVQEDPYRWELRTMDSFKDDDEYYFHYYAKHVNNSWDKPVARPTGQSLTKDLMALWKSKKCPRGPQIAKWIQECSQIAYDNNRRKKSEQYESLITLEPIKAYPEIPLNSA